MKEFSFSPQVLVVDASAGSGKTHALALRYLKLLLSWSPPVDPKEILAITFTNKAAQDMKIRIFDWLKKIALDSFSSPQEEEQILAFLKSKKTFLKEKANTVLSQLIKNYNYFQVKTIDSFLKTLMDSSSYFLQRSPYFRIVENPFPYLEYALEEFIKRAQKDESLSKLIKNFLRHYLEIENKASWFPKKDILRIISFLFYQSNLRGKIFSKKVIPYDLRENIDNLKKKLKKLEEVPYLYKTFQKSLRKALQEKDIFKSLKDISKHLQKDKLPVVKSAHPDKEVILLWKGIRQEVKNLCESYALSRFNLYIDILSETLKDLEELKEVRNIIFLEEINSKVNLLLKKNLIGISEIYSRLALKFSHYLVDEFQDTSSIQWRNLEPLVEEAISRGGSLFYVGDKKQAIYRFRAGDISLFDEVKEKFRHRAHVSEKFLSTNFRSQRAIVEFNNKVFSSRNLEIFLNHLEDRIDQEFFSSILDNFKGAKQNWIKEKDGGYVYVELIDEDIKENREKLIKEKLFSLIKELTKRGLPLNNIAILLRENEEVRKVTSWLIEEGFPVESERTLNIRENYLIKEIVSLLKFLSSPIDNLSFASFILGEIFLTVSHKSKEELTEFVFKYSGLGYLYRFFSQKYPQLWEDFFEEFFKSVGFLPLYEFLVSIFDRLKILENFPHSQAFFMKLLEVVRKKEEEDELTTINEFLEYLGEGKDEDFFVSVPENTEAIKVLTIHKAKGLQFEVVITPFLVLTLSWQGEKGDSSVIFEEGENLFLLYLRKDFTSYSSKLKKIYQGELVSSLIDELNVIYVALTRAKEELYIFIPKRKGNIPNLAKKLILDEEIKLTWGKKKPYFEKEKIYQVEFISPSSYQDWCKYMGEEFISRKDLKYKDIAFKGEVIHKALSLVENTKDEDLEKLTNEISWQILYQYPNRVEKEEIQHWLKNILGKDRLKRFFVLPSQCIVFNEKEIIDRKGALKRVDRLIIFSQEVWVIDYKSTHEELSIHQEQIKEYMEIISSLYPDKQIKGFLIFLDKLEFLEVK